MSKHDPISPLAVGSACGSPSHECQGGAKLAARPPNMGEIGFVGLGQMGTAMAANLAATGRRVVAYVRHQDQIGRLETLGLNPQRISVTCSTASS